MNLLCLKFLLQYTNSKSKIELIKNSDVQTKIAHECRDR